MGYFRWLRLATLSSGMITGVLAVVASSVIIPVKRDWASIMELICGSALIGSILIRRPANKIVMTLASMGSFLLILVISLIYYIGNSKAVSEQAAVRRRLEVTLKLQYCIWGIGMIAVTLYSFHTELPERASKTGWPAPDEEEFAEHERAWQEKFDVFFPEPSASNDYGAPRAFSRAERKCEVNVPVSITSPRRKGSRIKNLSSFLAYEGKCEASALGSVLASKDALASSVRGAPTSYQSVPPGHLAGSLYQISVSLSLPMFVPNNFVSSVQSGSSLDSSDMQNSFSPQQLLNLQGVQMPVLVMRSTPTRSSLELLDKHLKRGPIVRSSTVTPIGISRHAYLPSSVMSELRSAGYLLVGDATMESERTCQSLGDLRSLFESGAPSSLSEQSAEFFVKVRETRVPGILRKPASANSMPVPRPPVSAVSTAIPFERDEFENQELEEQKTYGSHRPPQRHKTREYPDFQPAPGRRYKKIRSVNLTLDTSDTNGRNRAYVQVHLLVLFSLLQGGVSIDHVLRKVGYTSMFGAMFSLLLLMRSSLRCIFLYKTHNYTRFSWLLFVFYCGTLLCAISIIVVLPSLSTLMLVISIISLVIGSAIAINGLTLIPGLRQLRAAQEEETESHHDVVFTPIWVACGRSREPLLDPHQHLSHLKVNIMLFILNLSSMMGLVGAVLTDDLTKWHSSVHATLFFAVGAVFFSLALIFWRNLPRSWRRIISVSAGFYYAGLLCSSFIVLLVLRTEEVMRNSQFEIGRVLFASVWLCATGWCVIFGMKEEDIKTANHIFDAFNDTLVALRKRDNGAEDRDIKTSLSEQVQPGRASASDQPPSTISTGDTNPSCARSESAQTV
eukprot:Blabericola_migrator_1__12294@NODE_768_length_6592_cov_139_084138_g546_i0_p1_GENE_NODE_768_length_6592_cov_139_084138_g546_i0NODE_768_length_6592_cov_139_084138_g546_i0_p1_ORF_typecomplete_len846_score70_58MFS_1/PF07690_16/55MFS_1/PF07690_16/0_44MFS_1/PF07690_16/0_19WTF/PF03303_13/0_46WTF/PF03303_13/1_3e03OAD_gamma/PF04277_13/84OAD_gamma/PF04277_13/9_4OAD_gamma/PF04277_13/4_8e03DUF543/PF04418_12/7_4e03DUF543/PF04418_12/0_82DUF543/PF04418_12/8_3e02_NODE_768_length_6592_cov_139_084138_g546_i019344